MNGILHSWPIEIDFNRAQIRSRIRETDIMDLKSVASYIVFKDGDKYYAKNGFTGIVEYSDVDATKVIQYAINQSKKGGVVAFRPGTYYIKPQFTYHLQTRPYAVGLTTDGADGLIIEGNGARLVADVGTEIILYVLNTSNSIIRNLVLDGNKDVQTWTYTDGKALLLAGGVRYNNRYENITVMNARGDGIYFGNHKPDEYGGGEQPEYNAVIRNIVSYNNADVGQGGVILDACVNTIAENIISHNDRIGLHISSPPNHPYPLIVKGVQILDAKYIGIRDFYGNAELYDVAMYASSQYFDEAFIKFTYPNARIKIEGLYIDASKVALGNSASSNGYYPIWAIVSASGNPLELTIRNAYIKTPTYTTYEYIAIIIIDNVKAHLENIKIVATYGFTIGGSTYTSSAVINNAEVSGVSEVAFNAYRSTVYIYNVLTPSFKVYARNDALAVFDKPYQIVPSGDIAGLRFLRNSGTATIAAGSTRVTVSHRLTAAPSKVLVTPLASPPGKLWIENITSTSFDIVTDTAPSSGLNVSWYAEV